jgi:hypothetical protein
VATKITFANLIGSLLSDIVRGDQQAAFATVSLVREVGFTNTQSDTNWGKLRMVTFNFEAPDPNDSDKKVLRTVEIPLLSLVPISVIGFEEAELEFIGKVEDFKQLDDKKIIKAFDFQSHDTQIELSAVDSLKHPTIKVKMKIKSSAFPGGINHILRYLDINSKEQIK